MKKVFLCLIISIALAFCACPALADKTPEETAKDAAESWLALADEGKYAESWDAAAGFFKNAVSEQDWQKAMEAFRVPLGKLVARKVKSAEFKTALPGAPDGEYVVIQFETVFENKKESIETVTPIKDKDGKWRVCGYFIK